MTTVSTGTNDYMYVVAQPHYPKFKLLADDDCIITKTIKILSIFVPVCEGEIKNMEKPTVSLCGTHNRPLN